MPELPHGVGDLLPVQQRLGNAVEASRNLEEAKRQISIIVKRSGDLVSISVTNYYQASCGLRTTCP